MNAGAKTAAAAAREIRAGKRRALAQSITALESNRAELRAQGEAVLKELAGNANAAAAFRVGVSGPPGVGKSTFIDALGLHLVQQGLRVAVLAVDPSSPVRGGSILGDKTRMARLAAEAKAFIRAQPSGGALGGVAARTREAMLLCEAAGYNAVLVETVGIGQSEAAVRGMVDFFAVLLQPGAGDELQGIKKGVLELADLLVVNKCDGALQAQAETTRGMYEQALQILQPTAAAGASALPPLRVLCASAQSGAGVAEVWNAVQAQRRALEAGGELRRRRGAQARDWMWSLAREALMQRFREHPAVAAAIADCEGEVARGACTPQAAAQKLLREFQG